MAAKIVIKGVPGYPVYSFMMESVVKHLSATQSKWRHDPVDGLHEMVLHIDDDSIAESLINQHPALLFTESAIGIEPPDEYINKIHSMSLNEFTLEFQ